MNKVLKKSILFLAVFILFLLVGNTSVFATDVTVPVTGKAIFIFLDI